MPRRSRHARHPAARSPRAAGGLVDLDPAARLRALVAEGIIASAALKAREDLERAVASTQRLGALTSGMWRALSRELATAAERLDRSIDERMENIHRLASALGVEEEEIVTIGFAAEHLESHRETLETLLPAGDDLRGLLGPNMLYGYSVEDSFRDVDAADEDAEEDGEDEGEGTDEDGDEDEDEDDDGDEDEVPAPWFVQVSLFLWPAPLTPAVVSFVPSMIADVTETDVAPLDLRLLAPQPLLDALSTASQISAERLEPALLALGIACWSAHQVDDAPPDVDEADEESDDEESEDDPSLEHDDSPGGKDR